MKILITGGAGLVGSECCKLFASDGWGVISIDNYTRGKLFGKESETSTTMMDLRKKYSIEHHEIDIRDEKIIEVVKKVDAVIHTAAQPSHPKSIEIPMEDFQINAYGTLFLLEAVRKYNKEIPFVFCSTNKVYGEAPNYFSYKKIGKRFEPIDPTLKDGFDESLRIDQMMHTPFGVSKAAADLYCQEYAHLYGLKTGIFRMGCITGGAAKAAEMHNWEPFFIKKALTGEELTIFGHAGYQVRDVIHAADLAKLFFEFIKKPRAGEVYNIGGARKNSISLIEAIDLIEDITNKKIKYKMGPEREADHIWWISNINKARDHYPAWNIRIGLKEVFEDIYKALGKK
ncbi:NAD-dependent epimerase/dehydratase family protein [Candidatus Micrarchaeota archaeon]|nr:NAD-dependent epimerase/dehydratase family protein [Candidatus Micrarchaeota archaeon]